MGTTGLLVTHNQHEAFAMADRIGVMQDGKLLQWDTADNLYCKPASYDVARFVGEGSFLNTRLNASGKVDSEVGIFNDNRLKPLKDRASVKLFIRPEDVYINPESSYKAKLIKSHFRGPGRFHTFELPSGSHTSLLISGVLLIFVAINGLPIILEAIQGIIKKKINVDELVSIAIIACLINGAFNPDSRRNFS